MAKRQSSEKRAAHPVDKHIGVRIRTLRLSQSLSQVMLGDGVDVSSQQIQKYETGANRVSASMLYEISTVLGTTVQALFEGFEPYSD